MKKYLLILVIFTLLTGCGSGLDNPEQTTPQKSAVDFPATEPIVSAGNAVQVSTDTATVVPTDTATVVPTDTATYTPTWTATDEATQPATHVPTQTSTPFVSPIAFSNIVALREEIPQIVWESAKNEVRSNYENSRSLVDLKVLVGPSTTLYYNENEDAYKNAIAFWEQFPQPPQYFAFLYNFEDKPWAVSKLKKMPFYSKGMERSIDAPCQHIPNACTGANSGIFGADTGVGVVGIYPLDASDPYRFGPLQIHEYTHAVQAAPWIGTKDPNRGHQTMPSACWLGEGQAHLAGLSVGSDSLEEYLQLREMQVKGHPVKGFNDYSADSIIDFYMDTDCLPGKSPEYALGYTIGYLTVEALSAIGGPTSSMGLNTRAALYGVGEVTEKEFNQIFQHVYGISWNEAMPILAEVVADTVASLTDNGYQ
tara:strand:+ start:4268 stop:5539 length:1272 start_codon:yes stop_codon:yes gene_type:complete